MERFGSALDAELDAVSGGSAAFKAVRGEYGSGKTFFTRHLAERALRRGWATAEVQVSETETPLHRLETAYSRVDISRGGQVSAALCQDRDSSCDGLERQPGFSAHIETLCARANSTQAPKSQPPL